MDKVWLHKQFESNPDKTKAQLARFLGLEPPAISKILSGGRQIKAHEYVRMREFFGVPERSGLGDGPRYDMPQDSFVISPLKAEGLAEPKPFQGQTEDSWVMPASLMAQKTKASPEQIKIFSVEESAMNPDFISGEKVLVDLSDTKPSPAGVFILSDGLGHIIRRCEYIAHSKPALIKISASSPQYETYERPLDEAGLIGRVIAKLQWL